MLETSGKEEQATALFNSRSAAAVNGRNAAAVAIAIPADGKGLPGGKGDYAAGNTVYETTCAACLTRTSRARRGFRICLRERRCASLAVVAR